MRERLSGWRLRIRALFRRRQLERDLEDELAFHLAMRSEGGDEDAARRRFGNPTRLKEICRDLWTFAPLEAFWADIRYAARLLRKSPAFTAVAVLSLALGIGANIAIYSVVRAVLLDPMPVPEPERLSVLEWGIDERADTSNVYASNNQEYGRRYTSSVSSAAYNEVRRGVAGSADLFAFLPTDNVNISVGGPPAVGSGLLVSGNYFSVLGVGTILGRRLEPADDTPGAAAVAVIGHAFWMRAFGGDPAIVGRSVKVNGLPFTIVGVTPKGFYGVSKGGWVQPTDITMPLAAQPDVARWGPVRRSYADSEEYWWLQVMARRRAGVSEATLKAALDVCFRNALSHSAVPSLARGKTPEVRLHPGGRGLESLREETERPLLILAGVSGLVLLLACVNLANLTLARGLARRRELAIRLALGSGRLRLVRQMLAESALLASAGGSIGVVLSLWSSRILVTMLTERPDQFALDLSFSLRLLAAAACISLFTGLLFGLIPALRLAGGGFGAALKGAAAGTRGRRMISGRVLLVPQVAISVLLLAGAGMFLRTMHNLAQIELGFNPRGIVLFEMDPILNGYGEEQVARLYQNVLASLEFVPGAVSSTVMGQSLLSGFTSNTNIRLDGPKLHYIDQNMVGPRFFETMRIPIVVGRGLGVQDHARAPKTAVINETAARRIFGGGNPVGRRFRTNDSAQAPEIEVVGVAKDAKYDKLRNEAEPTMYLPYLQQPIRTMHFAVRTAGDPAGMIPAIRAAVSEVDRDVPLMQLKTQTDQIEEQTGKERLFARLLAFFGGFALLLAAIGLHGVTAYSVARRTSEIGIRMAFGAQRGQVMRLVLRDVLLLSAIGVALGIPAASAASQLESTMLFGVGPGDLISVGAAAVLMCAVGLFAGYLPARRASRMDPLRALRYE